jgi:hypothetical protein
MVCIRYPYSRMVTAVPAWPVPTIHLAADDNVTVAVNLCIELTALLSRFTPLFPTDELDEAQSRLILHDFPVEERLARAALPSKLGAIINPEHQITRTLSNFYTRATSAGRNYCAYVIYHHLSHIGHLYNCMNTTSRMGTQNWAFMTGVGFL